MRLWHERQLEQINVVCTAGHDSGPLTADFCAAALIEFDNRYEVDHPGQRPFYSFGDHVSDPLAVVMRYLLFLNWTIVSPGRMICPEHKAKFV